MTSVETGRELSTQERQALSRILRQEDRARAELDRILDRRDATLRAYRWGAEDRAPVRPESLIAATVCPRYPTGLSRTTFYRAVGRTKDARPQAHGSDQDAPID